MSHCFDEIKSVQPEVKVKSVQQMIDALEQRFREKRRIKNGQVVDSVSNAKHYVAMRKELQAFVKEKYGRAFSSYYFSDITERFLLDYAFWIKEKVSGTGTNAVLPVSCVGSVLYATMLSRRECMV